MKELSAKRGMAFANHGLSPIFETGEMASYLDLTLKGDNITETAALEGRDSSS